MTRAYTPTALHAAGIANPLVLAAHGYFWTGAEVTDTPVGPALRGQTYVNISSPGSCVIRCRS